MMLCRECLVASGHHPHCPNAEDMPDQEFVLWFSGGWANRQYLASETAMRRAAEQYDFDADDVLRFGEVDMLDDNGVVVGGCYVEEDAYV
jgi:hypothetical protein